MRQLAPAASGEPQLLVWEKSVPKAPPIEMALIERTDGLLFFSVTVCGALVVPVCCDAKVKLAGERTAAGVTLRFVTAVCVTSVPVAVTVTA
jgi:hypothetical protein